METAEITIVFTSNYNGSYRVCYKLEIDTNYTCVVIEGCAIGENCEVIFPVEIINDTCEDQILEGYIQPLCEDIESEDNRVEWQMTFIPNNPCKKYSLYCTQGSIGTITVNSGTATYDPMNPPSLIISEPGGIGSGAILTPVIDGGGLIIGVTVVDGGELYGEDTTVSVNVGTGTLPTFVVKIICNAGVELPDCSGDGQVIPTLTLGIPYQICTLESVTIDMIDTDSSKFNVNKETESCTCSCISYSVENTSPFLTLPFRYYDCEGVYHITSITPVTTLELCIGTYGTYLLSNFIEVTELGECS